MKSGVIDPKKVCCTICIRATADNKFQVYCLQKVICVPVVLIDNVYTSIQIRGDINYLLNICVI